METELIGIAAVTLAVLPIEMDASPVVSAAVEAKTELMRLDLSPNFHPPISRVPVTLQRDRTLDHPELEFCASDHVGGLVAPTWFCSKIGGLLPIAPWGRSSL